MTSRRTFLQTLLAAPAALVALATASRATPHSVGSMHALRTSKETGREERRHVEYAASIHRSIGDDVRSNDRISGLSFDTLDGTYRSFYWPHVEGESRGHRHILRGRAERWEHLYRRAADVKDLSVAYWEDRNAIARDGYWPGRNAGWQIMWWEDVT